MYFDPSPKSSMVLLSINFICLSFNNMRKQASKDGHKGRDCECCNNVLWCRISTRNRSLAHARKSMLFGDIICSYAFLNITQRRFFCETFLQKKSHTRTVYISLMHTPQKESFSSYKGSTY